MTLYQSGEWLTACSFHSTSEHEILEALHHAVRSHQEGTPVILFDLDSTLYEVEPRTHAIIKLWYEERRRDLIPSVERALAELALTQVRYNLRDTFSVVGLDMDDPQIFAAWQDLKAFWHQRFFSNDYLHLDRPYDGALEFVTKLHEAGAHVAYITGRERAKMEPGTLRNLERDRFPLGERATLHMKEDGSLDDAVHKSNVAKIFSDGNTILASLENEPKNFAALFTTIPNAKHIFVETICSDHPAPACHGVYRLKAFPPKN